MKATEETPHDAARRAVMEARRAQPDWGRLTVKARLKQLRPLRSFLAARVDDLVAAVEAVQPRAPGDTVAAEILPLAEAWRFVQKRAPALLAPRYIKARWLPLWLSRVGAELHRDPHGLILILGPANYPLFLPGSQALQALAAGNAVVVKPGRGGRPVMDLLAELVHQCGVDPALFTVLDESVEAAASALDERPDKVVLTGGLETGRAVLERLARDVVPSVMELSGCDALFVLDGADLDRVVRALVFGMRLNRGATCMAPHRVFVPRRLAAELGERLARAAETLGPVDADRAILDRAAPLLAAAEASGGRRLAGDLGSDGPITPVVLADASPNMDLLKADLFCPIVALVPVADMDEALRADDLCPFALTASVFGPEREAMALARQIRAGAVVVNDVIAPTVHPELPFGGRGLSGFGSTRGVEGLLEMTAVKAVAFRRGRWLPHLDRPQAQTETLLRHLLAASHGAGRLARLRHWTQALKAAVSPAAGPERS